MKNFWTGFKEKLDDVKKHFQSEKTEGVSSQSSASSKTEFKQLVEKVDASAQKPAPVVEPVVQDVPQKVEKVVEDKPAPVKPEPVRPAPVQSSSVASKPSKSQEPEGLLYELKIHQYNWYLLIIAILLTSIFLVGLLSDDSDDATKKDAKPAIVIEQSVMSDPSEIAFSKEEIFVENHKSGEIFTDKLIISSSKGNIKIIGVKMEPFASSLLVESNDCLNADQLVEKIDDCEISFEWMPMGDVTVDVSLVVEWEDLSALKPKVYTDKIPVFLQTALPEPEPKPVPKKVVKPQPPVEIDLPEEPVKPAPNPEPKPEVKPEPKPEPVKEEAVQKSAAKNVKTMPNCRRFATRAYSLEGDAIGWVQGNNSVFDHRCTRVLGKRLKNGEIVGVNSGKKIGYDAEAFKTYKHMKKLTLDIPQGLMNFDDATGSDAAHWAAVDAARKAATGGAAVNDISQFKMKDPFNAMSNYLASKKPFSIATSDQVSTKPKSEEYVVRKFKPIPAVLAFPLYTQGFYGGIVPATAIVERNIYGENGRNIIIPAGSKILGQASSTWPNSYTAFAKVEVVWHRIIRPDGAEFVFNKVQPITGDAQGRLGVPGKGTTDYLEQFMQPLMTAMVPAAINMISPSADAFTRKFIIDDDGKTSVTESGEISSKERAKQEIIKTWNTVASKFVEDSMKNTTPPFTVPAGTRLTIFPQQDIMLRFTDMPELDSIAQPVGDVAVTGVKMDNSQGQNQVGQQGAALKAVAEQALWDKMNAEATAPAPKPKQQSNNFNDVGSGGEWPGPVIGMSASGLEVYKDEEGEFIFDDNGDPAALSDEYGDFPVQYY